MKICVTSTGQSVDSTMDPRFGRCAYFIIIDPDSMDFESIPNDSVNAGGGAGVKSSQTLIDKGVDVLITGDVGPNALRILNTSNIKVIVGVNGTVKELVEKFKKGLLG
ncbi:MAG: NifB/NifX family molybdenum-iron cluster-binding protein [bacterium]|uniref:Dinitrogenase iron-molybdenum cofactor biosynthesi n=2 Tax=Bacteria candidate phyla TaxID=1783234 RepID=A0A101I2K3_UNCT6|nr:MAG: Dinitrogenase [candidate division TA06 bacterium 32_111]KUK87616.1 MAG: Dinitrogenase iron-molybdenum cofactor biosynthesi [candidate division TA06 bacterium 34_109]MDI6699750.1 NifB/NifX family molybdenum-iron cluster-binding protein [bacterium]HAF07454.1 dinitrogenase iron-molybdenum cofactor biosynthesis protein [candidate division WOR-3 bacterium]HCP17523.1 dinitrogenase iron-molybdenum cofactor biosynthesis protein [candidate division WOR-3 bacterium]